MFPLRTVYFLCWMLKDLAPLAPPFTAPSGLDKLCPSRCWRPSPSPWNSSGDATYSGISIIISIIITIIITIFTYICNTLGTRSLSLPFLTPVNQSPSISKHLPLPAVPPPWCWGFPHRTSPPSAPAHPGPRARLRQARRQPPRGNAWRSNGSCHRLPDPRCGRLSR